MASAQLRRAAGVRAADDEEALLLRDVECGPLPESSHEMLGWLRTVAVRDFRSAELPVLLRLACAALNCSVRMPGQFAPCDVELPADEAALLLEWLDGDKVRLLCGDPCVDIIENWKHPAELLRQGCPGDPGSLEAYRRLCSGHPLVVLFRADNHWWTLGIVRRPGQEGYLVLGAESNGLAAHRFVSHFRTALWYPYLGLGAAVWELQLWLDPEVRAALVAALVSEVLSSPDDALVRLLAFLCVGWCDAVPCCVSLGRGGSAC